MFASLVRIVGAAVTDAFETAATSLDVSLQHVVDAIPQRAVSVTHDA